MRIPLRLYKDDEVEGYDSRDVERWLKVIGRLNEWNEWFAGSTGAIIKGRFIVYRWDLEGFLDAKRNDD